MHLGYNLGGQVPSQEVLGSIGLCSSRYFSEVFSSWWNQPWNSTHISFRCVCLCGCLFIYAPIPLSPLKIKQISLHQETSLALLVLRPFFPKITFIKGSKVGSHSGSVDPSVLLFPRRISREMFWDGKVEWGWRGWMDGEEVICVFFWCFWKIYTPEITSMTMETQPFGSMYLTWKIRWFSS